MLNETLQWGGKSSKLFPPGIEQSTAPLTFRLPVGEVVVSGTANPPSSSSSSGKFPLKQSAASDSTRRLPSVVQPLAISVLPNPVSHHSNTARGEHKSHSNSTKTFDFARGIKLESKNEDYGSEPTKLFINPTTSNTKSVDDGSVDVNVDEPLDLTGTQSCSGSSCRSSETSGGRNRKTAKHGSTIETQTEPTDSFPSKESLWGQGNTSDMKNVE